jgi:hypothetical protein
MAFFLKRSILFIVYSFFFYASFVFLWTVFVPGDVPINVKYIIGAYGHMNSRIKDLATVENVDVLFLGSSHAYRGFDPRIFSRFGIKSFNLGSSSQTPIQTEILIERYLRSLNPELVILEVFPTMLTIDGVESALDLVTNDKNDLMSLKMAFGLQNILVFNTLIHATIIDLLDWDDYYTEPVQKGKDTYIKGGYVEKHTSASVINDTYPSTTREYLKIQEKVLERIINKLKKLNIDTIIVQAPVTRAYYDSFSDNSEIDSYLRSLADYYNFNDILELSTSRYFYDSHHLNQDGVEIFNRTLIDILKENSHL